MQSTTCSKTLWFILIFVSLITSSPTSQTQGRKVQAEDYGDGNVADSEGSRFENEFIWISPSGNVSVVHFDKGHSDKKQHVPLGIVPDKKIIGGHNVKSTKEVPYQVGIHLGFNHPHCGGTIYNNVTIITAAHCYFDHNDKFFEENFLRKIKYIAGNSNINSEEGTEQTRNSIKVIPHPEYDPEYSYNDIAIVKLDKPFEYNEFVQPLPVGGIPALVPENVKYAIISGYGYTKKRVSGEKLSSLYRPTKLKYTKVTIFSQKECLEFYSKNTFIKGYIDNGLICAGQESGDQDTCQGDSGGPLACIDPARGDKRYFCGVVSTGIGCGQPKSPGLYTRVSTFHKWIISHVGYADPRTVNSVNLLPN